MCSSDLETGEEKPNANLEEVRKLFMKLNPEQRKQFLDFLQEQNMMGLHLSLASAVASASQIHSGLMGTRKAVTGQDIVGEVFASVDKIGTDMEPTAPIINGQTKIT